MASHFLAIARSTRWRSACSCRPPKRSVSKGDPQPPRRTREILEHYLANPETLDSLEGLAAWRLLEEFVARRVAETEAAVGWLVERGYLDRRAPMAAPPIYSLNEGRRAEADRLVAELRESEEPGERRRPE